MTAADKLRMIAKMIEDEPWRWVQRGESAQVYNPIGRYHQYGYCATGWLAAIDSLSREPIMKVALQPLCDAIKEAPGISGMRSCGVTRTQTIQIWNDRRGRTVEEVVAAFRKAADLLDPDPRLEELVPEPDGVLV